jgi:hypothetical protein
MRIPRLLWLISGALLLPVSSRGASLESKPPGVHVTVSGRVGLAGVTHEHGIARSGRVVHEVGAVGGPV